MHDLVFGGAQYYWLPSRLEGLEWLARLLCPLRNLSTWWHEFRMRGSRGWACVQSCCWAVAGALLVMAQWCLQRGVLVPLLLPKRLFGLGSNAFHFHGLRPCVLCPTKARSTPAWPQPWGPLRMAAAANGELVAWRAFGQDFHHALLLLIPHRFLKRQCDTPTQSGGVPSAA